MHDQNWALRRPREQLHTTISLGIFMVDSPGKPRAIGFPAGQNSSQNINLKPNAPGLSARRQSLRTNVTCAAM
jgi:hypothetical protein